MDRIKVLSIVGPGRSGTTVLAAVLGEVAGVVDVGEMRWLWQRGVLERRSCGCGSPVDECPVWSAVLDKVQHDRAGSTRQLAEQIAAAQRVLIYRRHRRRVIRRGATGTPWPPLEIIRTSTAQVVRAVAEVTGATVIVDSSKRAQDAAVLAGLDDVDHYVLHMVRDPRAVAYSWGKRDKMIRVAEGTRTMGSRGLLSSVTRWTENGLGAGVLRRLVPPERWMFLRYEDFACRPRHSVAEILAFLREDGAPPFVDEDTVVLRTNHTVAGNPNRFRTGPVQIRLDSEWRRRMPRHRQALAQLLTWPLMLRYRSAPDRPVTRRRRLITRLTRPTWRAARDVRTGK